MGRPRTVKGATRTTIYIYHKNIVQNHMDDIGENQYKDYINRLISEDILANGDEEIIKKYFGKEK